MGEFTPDLRTTNTTWLLFFEERSTHGQDRQRGSAWSNNSSPPFRSPAGSNDSGPGSVSPEADTWSWGSLVIRPSDPMAGNHGAPTTEDDGTLPSGNGQASQPPVEIGGGEERMKEFLANMGQPRKKSKGIEESALPSGKAQASQAPFKIGGGEEKMKEFLANLDQPREKSKGIEESASSASNGLS